MWLNQNVPLVPCRINNYAQVVVLLFAICNHLSTTSRLSSLKINYNTYGEGESKLAWYDQEFEIYSNDNNAVKEAMDIMKGIYKKIRLHNYSIGHLKFLLNGETKISYRAVC